MKMDLRAVLVSAGPREAQLTLSSWVRVCVCVCDLH
jgi:hypothetical protein